MLTMLALRVDMKFPKETAESTIHLPAPRSVPIPEDRLPAAVSNGCF